MYSRATGRIIGNRPRLNFVCGIILEASIENKNNLMAGFTIQLEQVFLNTQKAKVNNCFAYFFL